MKKLLTQYVNSVHQQLSNNMNSIFVSIASYKDTEIFQTLIDLFKRAKHPEKIYVGVFIQDEDSVFKNFQVHFNDNKNIKTIHVLPKYAEGPGWARNIIMKELYNNEDYFLLVDSHSRFKNNWDVEYIDMLKKTPTESVLSGFPRNYEFEEPYETYSKRNLCSIYIPNDIPHVGKLAGPHLQKIAKKENEKIMNISAGNMFGKGSILNILIVDDYSYYGECEQELYSLLLYQCGLDIYAPSENLVWHKYFVIGVDNYRKMYKPKEGKTSFWPHAADINCTSRSSDFWLKEYNDFINRHKK